MREKEYKRAVKTLEEYTRFKNKDSLIKVNPSTNADHAVKENHTVI